MMIKLEGGDGQIGKVPYRIWNWALPLWFFLLNFYLLIALYSALSSLALPA